MLNKQFLIAEVGLAHEGSLGIAQSFAKIAKLNGADAIKFQHHNYEYESSKNEKFRKKFSLQDKSRTDYWKRTSFSFNEWKKLKAYCDKINIKFICSPFSIESAKELNKIGLFAWKIASGEFNNIPLLEYILKNSNKPIILSTGLTTINEISKIIRILKKNKKKNYALLQCTSKYPTNLEDVGHDLVIKLKKRFKCKVGISDHSGQINSLIIGLSKNADILEFHVTFDKNFFGPDTSSSITPNEVKFLSNLRDDFNKIKNVYTNKEKLSSNQKKMIKLFGKSIYAKHDLKENKKIKLDNLKFLKPGNGIKVADYKKVLGKFTKRPLKKNQLIKFSDLK